MNDLFYIVFRIYFNGNDKHNSIQYFNDKLEASQRFYNVIAADLADPTVTYQYAEIKDSEGRYVDGIAPVIYDRRS